MNTLTQCRTSQTASILDFLYVDQVYGGKKGKKVVDTDFRELAAL